MRISIALTARNAERYLPPLLESLAEQKHLPYELVAHDDASGDATGAILRAFAEWAPFDVRIERADERRGFVDGFLRAAKACRGELVAFCDGDDVWLPDKLARCARAFERPDVSLALHTARVVDAELRDIAPPWPAIEETRVVPPLAHVSLDLDAPGMAMVFRRGLLDLVDPARRPHSRYDPERQMIHDEWILFVAGVVGCVQLIADPLVLYRQHGANDSGWFERSRELSLKPAVDDYRAAAAHYAACAGSLEAALPDAVETADSLAAGAERYRQIAAAWDLRASLYRARSRRSRARVLAQLVSGRAYGPRPSGGLGRLALAKDLAGVIATGQGPGPH